MKVIEYGRVSTDKQTLEQQNRTVKQIRAKDRHSDNRGRNIRRRYLQEKEIRY